MDKQPLMTAAANLDLRALVAAARERSWIVALCTATVVVSAGAYLYRTPNIFAAHAVLKVEEEGRQIIQIQEVQKENLESQESLKTVEQTLKNAALLQRVIDVNGFTTNGLLAASSAKPLGRQELVEELSEALDVRLRRGTRLIDVTVEHSNPALSARIANSLIQEFLRTQTEQHYEISANANQFLSDELEQQRKKLEASENALQKYRQDVFSVSLEDRQTIVVQKLKDLNQRATAIKSERLAQESLCRAIAGCSNDLATLLAVPAIADDVAVAEPRSALAKAEAEFANLQQEYKAKHPKYIQAQSQVAELKKALAKAAGKVQETATVAYRNLVQTEKALDIAIREQEAAALELNKQSIQYSVLLRDVESNRALYQSVLNRAKETDLAKDLRAERIRVIQPALVPERPIKPRKVRILALSVLGGLAAGIGLALVMRGLDRSINSIDEAEEFLGVPVLANVPKFAANTAQGRLIDEPNATTPEAEAFRTLRTALSMLGHRDERRTFLFTSALPGEGKTLCGLNYASSLAQQGLRTLIIDADLRRPAIEASFHFGTQKGSRGLTDCLVGQAQFEDVIQTGGVENLFFLAAGTTAPNPAELLGQGDFKAILTKAAEQFDRVIVDTAPLLAVSDTLLLAGDVQSVCLVVQAHRTDRQHVGRALQMLKSVKAPIAGVILNRLARIRRYGYYYGSYSSEVYGAPRKQAAATV